MANTISTFFVPGPTGVSDEILNELTRPLISHRSKEYAELHQEVITRLKTLFNWENYHVFLSTSSASGLMEGVVRNCVNENIAHTICGAFSDKWSNISELNGKKVCKLEIPWGQAIKPAQVKDFLETNKPEAITITYCETSTGVLNPLREICEVIKDVSPETLILVDAVSAFGGAQLEMESWGIDVMLFGVQKTFALPPGLAIAVVSKRAFEKSLTVKNKGYYFNFEVFAKYNEKNNTPDTPAIPLIRALRKQLERIETEGLNKRYDRHKQMMEMVNTWRQKHDIQFFSEEGYQSPTVSTLKVPPNITIETFTQKLKEKGYTVPGGYGQLKDSTFRIGHMGEHTTENIEKLLEAMTEALTI